VRRGSISNAEGFDGADCGTLTAAAARDASHAVETCEKRSARSSEFVGFASERDRDEALEQLVEPLTVADGGRLRLVVQKCSSPTPPLPRVTGW